MLTIRYGINRTDRSTGKKKVLHENHSLAVPNISAETLFPSPFLDQSEVRAGVLRVRSEVASRALMRLIRAKHPGWNVTGYAPGHDISPEEIDRYVCIDCGNTDSFVGVDKHGYPGDHDCESRDPLGLCECETELRQPFHLARSSPNGDTEVIYAAFEGGGCGAEIGPYTSIVCGRCDAIVWKQPTTNRGEHDAKDQEHDDVLQRQRV